MKILALSGSARDGSLNLALLNFLAESYPQVNITIDSHLHKLALFNSGTSSNNPSKNLLAFKNSLTQADAVIISTPEYLHNFPAALKNAFEWCAATGEFAHKKVLPICYTPSTPRGEKAMQSLLWSLNALNASVPGSLIIHHTEISFDNNGKLTKNLIGDLIDSSIELLVD